MWEHINECYFSHSAFVLLKAEACGLSCDNIQSVLSHLTDMQVNFDPTSALF